MLASKNEFGNASSFLVCGAGSISLKIRQTPSVSPLTPELFCEGIFFITVLVLFIFMGLFKFFHLFNLNLIGLMCQGSYYLPDFSIWRVFRVSKHPGFIRY